MQTILLLHGAIGAKDQLEPLEEKLKTNFIVHTLSFSGHGGEPMPEIFSIEHFAKDVLKYLERNKNIKKSSRSPQNFHGPLRSRRKKLKCWMQKRLKKKSRHLPNRSKTGTAHTT